MRQQAAVAADLHRVAGSPHPSSQQGIAAGSSTEPTLQSSVGQQAAGNAQQADTSSISVHGQKAAPDLPEQAAGEISTGEEGGVQTEGGVEGRLESSSGEQGGMLAGLQEPSLQSGLGQRAAFVEDGGSLFAAFCYCAASNVTLATQLPA